MSYGFVDVINEGASPGLPAEALSFNGVFLENLIPGYRTLYVRGRELLAPELALEQIGTNDGSDLLYKRFPERLITVGYQLMAGSNTDFRDAFNQLNAVLDCENATLVFHDELDKYFKGTLSEITEPDPGSNSVKGEMVFTCPDPYKYSVMEQEASPENGLITVQYGGTVPSHPVLEAELASELGFVGFVNQDGRMIQIGDPEEADDEEYEKSETLIDHTFSDTAGWTLNSAVTQNDYPQQGSVRIDSEYGVTGNNYGSNTTTWHGPSLIRTIPADSHGDSGASNWTVSWKHIFFLQPVHWASDYMDSKGEFVVGITGIKDGTELSLAEMHVHKSVLGNSGAVNFNVLGKKQGGMSFPIDILNSGTQINALANSIERFGNVFTFTFYGKVFSYTVNAAEGISAVKVWIMFEQYKNQKLMAGNACESIRFIKHGVSDRRDVPNKLLPGDVITADCNTGRITLNGNEAYGLGALGNDWESFALRPGENQIQCLYSDWGASSPDFIMRYREVFL